MIAALVEVARTGPASILLHPLRSTVTVLAVAAVLVPYLVGMGLAEGLRREAGLAIGEPAGSEQARLPDLYVSGSRFGRRVPIPLSQAELIGRFEGVTRVVPRIVGRVTLGTDRVEAVLVGIPLSELERTIAERLPQKQQLADLFDGQMPRSRRGDQPELLLGGELARRLRLKVGTVIPPIFASTSGAKTPRITGIFRSDNSLWQANVILTTFETAADLFDQQGLATDLLVYCRPGQPAAIRARILAEGTVASPDGTTRIQTQITSRDDLRALLSVGLGHREGVFNLHFVIAFSIGILAILVTSGFGLAERRREIGILKACGWQTDEILLRSLVESLLLSLAGAAVSIVLAFAWLEWFNGFWIAGIFLAGVETAPGFPIPFVLAPIPALLAVLVACVLVMSGTAYSSWRSAVISPAEAMR